MSNHSFGTKVCAILFCEFVSRVRLGRSNLVMYPQEIVKPLNTK